MHFAHFVLVSWYYELSKIELKIKYSVYFEYLVLTLRKIQFDNRYTKIRKEAYR